jgi:hypothetical protein
MAILPKAIHMSNANPIKIPMTFYTEIGKTFMKCIWKHKRPGIAKAILSNLSNAGGITIPDFKPYYRDITIKNSMILAQKHTERPMDQSRRSRHKPHIYSQLIFDKETQNTQWRKDILFNKCCWKTGYPHAED